MCSSIWQSCVQKLAWPTAPAQQGALFGAGKQLSCHFAACGILTSKPWTLTLSFSNDGSDILARLLPKIHA